MQFWEKKLELQDIDRILTLSCSSELISKFQLFFSELWIYINVLYQENCKTKGKNCVKKVRIVRYKLRIVRKNARIIKFKLKNCVKKYKQDKNWEKSQNCEKKVRIITNSELWEKSQNYNKLRIVRKKSEL